MLAELMRLYSTISFTGTHGKTTTSSLLSHIFTEAGEVNVHKAHIGLRILTVG